MISVTVPVYKVEKYLRKCVDSILAQTYTDIEIILVDDGSPDGCGAICDEYAKRDNRVRVIHKANGGLSDARNAGIAAASGEYMAFVDSDDYIHPQMLEKLYSALCNANADMAICNYLYVSEDGTECGDNSDLPIKDGILTGDDVLFNEIRGDNDKRWCWVVAWNRLYRRDLFDDIKFPVGKIHEDEFIIHKLYAKCNAVACVSEPLYYYVQRKGSIMNSSYDIRHLDFSEAVLGRCEYFMDIGSDADYVYEHVWSAVSELKRGYLYYPAREYRKFERYRQVRKQSIRVMKRALKLKLSAKRKIRLMSDIICPYPLRKYNR